MPPPLLRARAHALPATHARTPHTWFATFCTCRPGTPTRAKNVTKIFPRKTTFASAAGATVWHSCSYIHQPGFSLPRCPPTFTGLPPHALEALRVPRFPARGGPDHVRIARRTFRRPWRREKCVSMYGSLFPKAQPRPCRPAPVRRNPVTWIS